MNVWYIFTVWWCVFSGCDNNMFGQNCSKPCGKCLGLKQCDHINGTCMAGCNRGFQGELCYEGGYLLILSNRLCIKSPVCLASLFSSPEPKAQVSFSDQNLSVVRRHHRRRRRWRCRKHFTFSSSSQNHWAYFNQT